MKENYPVFLDLCGKKCLVVGGGAVATRKVKTLLAVKAQVTVVSLQCTGEIQKLEKQGHITLIQDEYKESFLQGAFLVISATNDRRINQQVYRGCVSRNLLVNVVDDPKHSNFFVPSVVSRGHLSIAISTEGRSPAFARHLREELEQQYGPEYGEFLEVLGHVRGKVKARVKDQNIRSKLLKEIASPSWLHYFLTHSRKKYEEKVKALITHYSTTENNNI